MERTNLSLFLCLFSLAVSLFGTLSLSLFLRAETRSYDNGADLLSANGEQLN